MKQRGISLPSVQWRTATRPLSSIQAPQAAEDELWVDTAFGPATSESIRQTGLLYNLTRAFEEDRVAEWFEMLDESDRDFVRREVAESIALGGSEWQPNDAERFSKLGADIGLDPTLLV